MRCNMLSTSRSLCSRSSLCNAAIRSIISTPRSVVDEDCSPEVQLFLDVRVDLGGGGADVCGGGDGADVYGGGGVASIDAGGTADAGVGVGVGGSVAGVGVGVGGSVAGVEFRGGADVSGGGDGIADPQDQQNLQWGIDRLMLFGSQVDRLP
ncbi:hypothetical protein INT47_005575 [Mucor saturninus]|uniref:Uncharacterized protein n=1 Tax=Mucor saturninus TaxID=64648 RepID=A0A8H7REP8_9FUNG|nr:hypothetical protein INT47_005575 [Mucor saturninus]